MNTIKLWAFWDVLADRKMARDIFTTASKNNFEVIFDLAGVTFMNTSFADELFARAFEEKWPVFKIKNAESDFIKNIIIFVSQSRKNKPINA